MRKLLLLCVLGMSTLTLTGCTTCDVALWLGQDVCEIGGT